MCVQEKGAGSAPPTPRLATAAHCLFGAEFDAELAAPTSGTLDNLRTVKNDCELVLAEVLFEVANMPDCENALVRMVSSAPSILRIM